MAGLTYVLVFRFRLCEGAFGIDERTGQRLHQGLIVRGWTRELLLRAPLRFHTLLLLSFHFFLALLERRLRRSHRFSSNIVPDWCLRLVKLCCVLPARLARLPRAIAVILVREPATLLTASTTFATAVAVSASITASVTIEATTTATAWSTGGRLGTRFIDLQIAPADFLPIEAGNRFGGLRVIGHFDERESTGSACFPVHRNVDAADLSKRFEQRTQIRFRCLETHIANEQVLHVLLSFDL
jgi:hypothetical protein